MKNIFSTIIAVLFFGFLHGETKENSLITDSIDVICYNLHVQIIPSDKKIIGKAILHSKSLEKINTVLFNLDRSFKVESALLLKKKNSWDSLSFKQQSNKILVVLPKQIKKGKEIYVQVNFKSDFKGIDSTNFNWTNHNNLDPFIKVQPNKTPFYWWPCVGNQKADSMDLSVSIPKDLRCISIGYPKKTEDFNENFQTHKWKVSFPIKTDDIPIFIGNYIKSTKDYKSIDNKKVRIDIWTLSNTKHNSQSLMQSVSEELHHFESKFGAFPRKTLSILKANTSRSYNYPSLVVKANKGSSTISSQWFHPYFLSIQKGNNDEIGFVKALGNYANFLFEDSFNKTPRRKNMKRIHEQLRVQLSYPEPYNSSTISKFYTSSINTINRYLSPDKLYPILKNISGEIEKNKWPSLPKISYKMAFFDLINQPHLNDLAKVPAHLDSIPQLGVFFYNGKLKIVWKKPKDYLTRTHLEIEIGETQNKLEMNKNLGEISIKKGENFSLDFNQWFFSKKPDYQLGENNSVKYNLQDYYSNNPWLHSHTQQIMQALTDTQKIAQMIITSGGKHGKPVGVIKNLISEQKVGGVIFLKGNKTVFKNLITELDSINKTNSKIPLVYSMDAEPSLIKGRLTGFPETPKTIEIKDTTECKYIANRIDSALLEIGVRQNFAPVCDLSPNNVAISNRSFGSNPDVVKKMALSYIKATQKDQIIATAKHFPGHGMVKGDTHKQSVYIDGEMKELPVYEPLIAGGVISIMVAHIVVKKNPVYDTNGLPSSCSKKIITDLLKTEMGFKGLVVSDALNIMKAVTIIDKAPLKASMAGCDFILMPKKEGVVIKNILNEINTNPYYKERVYHSVNKIIRVKICLGLL